MYTFTFLQHVYIGGATATCTQCCNRVLVNVRVLVFMRVQYLYLQLGLSVRTYIRDGNRSRMCTLPNVL